MARKVISFVVMLLMLMLGMFAIRWAANKFNIPVISTIANNA